MKKYLFFVSFLSFIIYYFLTLCLSFAFLSNAVVKNDSIALEKYIDAEELKKNFYYEIYDFGLNQINKFEKNFKTQNNSIEFSGELTERCNLPELSDNFTARDLSELTVDTRSTAFENSLALTCSFFSLFNGITLL